jgi:hypothetical protein
MAIDRTGKLAAAFNQLLPHELERLETGSAEEANAIVRKLAAQAGIEHSPLLEELDGFRAWAHDERATPSLNPPQGGWSATFAVQPALQGRLTIVERDAPGASPVDGHGPGRQLVFGRFVPSDDPAMPLKFELTLPPLPQSRLPRLNEASDQAVLRRERFVSGHFKDLGFSIDSAPSPFRAEAITEFRDRDQVQTVASWLEALDRVQRQ